jgi:pimeloyl-ACP methyl ester carboxylesterase
VQRGAVDRLGPQSVAAFSGSPRAIAWRDKPATYVVCSDDRGLPAALQRSAAKRCATSVEWPTSHSPFLSRPDLVAELLIDLSS